MNDNLKAGIDWDSILLQPVVKDGKLITINLRQVDG